MLFGKKGTVVGCMTQKEETEMQVLDHIKQMMRLKFASLKNIEADHINMNLVRSWELPQSIFS